MTLDDENRRLRNILERRAAHCWSFARAAQRKTIGRVPPADIRECKQRTTIGHTSASFALGETCYRSGGTWVLEKAAVED